jgi:4-amino-4-deoxy-L-arabinose transferase-like glycosyltransferase
MNPAIANGWRELAPPLMLLVVAMALFAWAALPPTRRPITGQKTQADDAHRWAYALALGAYVLALILTLAVGESSLVRWLWVGGMALLVAAHIGWDDAPRLNQADGRDILILVGITAVAFVLRFWRLPDLPSQFHTDIAAQGLQALEVLGDPGRGWFDVGWSNIPMFDFVMMAGAMKLFGADLFGLSMTAVIQGTLTIPALYLLGREMFGRRVGLLAAALLAISFTHIHFSRIVTTASPLLFITLSFFFLFRGLRLRRGVWFALAGINLGLGLLVYYPGRVAVIIVVALFLWLLLWKREAVVDNIRQWLLFGFGALLGFGPMLASLLMDFDAFVGRGKLVTLWNPTVMAHLAQKYGVDSSAQVWLEQLKRTFLTFFLYPDASTHFGFPSPLVSALTATLLVLGLGYGLRWLRDERIFTLVVWMLATLLLGGVSTNDPPFWPHLVIVLPAVMLLAAIGAERAWTTVVQNLPDRRRRQALWFKKI